MYKLTKGFSNGTTEVIFNIETLNQAIALSLNSIDADLVSISDLNNNELKAGIIPNLRMVVYL